MPNRIIKESVCTSDTIDQMTWFEECFFHRLWTACDDYGRMDARPAILKAKLFPLKDRLSLKDIESALVKLADIGCVRPYECDGKPYLYLPAWEVHQQIRAKRSKYPAPDNSCNHMNADACKCPCNPIQSESESESESEDSTERQAASAPPVCLLPLNTGKEYAITAAQVEEWGKLYPAVDIMQALNAMRGWCLANPTKRKTARGILSFVNRWLAKEQDQVSTKRKLKTLPKNDKTIDTSNPFLEILMETEGENGQN